MYNSSVFVHHTSGWSMQDLFDYVCDMPFCASHGHFFISVWSCPNVDWVGMFCMGVK